jgi:hypothetical protein
MERQASLHQSASSIRFCHDPLLLKAEWPARSQLRASSDHRFTVGLCEQEGWSGSFLSFLPSLTRKRSGDYSQNPVEIAKFMRT